MEETLLASSSQNIYYPPHMSVTKNKEGKFPEDSLLISTNLHNNLITNSTKLIIFDTKKFKNIIFSQKVINNNLNISFVNDQKFEIQRKI